MKRLRNMIRKTAGISLSAAIAVSMLPVQVFASIEYDSGVNDYGDKVNERVEVDADYNDVTVTGGDIDAQDKWPIDALCINASEGHTATVTTGNITKEDGRGITVNNYPDTEEGTGGTTMLTVNGDVNASGNVSVGYSQTMGQGETSTEINGNVSAGWRGVYSRSRSGESDLTVNGDVTAEYGIEAETYDDAVSDITVNGNVNAEKTGVEAHAGDDALLDVTIEGNVNGGKQGVISWAYNKAEIGIEVNRNVDGSVVGVAGQACGGSDIDIKVKGDITSDEYGIYAEPFIDEDEGEGFGTVSVLAEGTVTGGKVGVLLHEDADSRKNVTVTAWKITPNKDGMVAGYEKEDDETETIYEDEDFEKNNINYIIRVEQPESGATLAASGDTAHEGENVTLRIDLDQNYVITGAFSDEGKSVPLLTDAEGNYYVVVPRGGGVLLSVTVGEKPAPQPAPQPAEEDDDNDVQAPETVNSNIGNVAENSVVVSSPENLDQTIRSVPQGGTVSVVLTEGTGLSNTVIAALSGRSDVTLDIIFVYNGLTYRAIIPAGFNLAPFLNAAGGIDFETLAVHFGTIMQ